MSFSVTGKELVGGRKPPSSEPPFQGVQNQGVVSGGLCPPILKFSFQVGDVWFCGIYPALPLNLGVLA